MNMKTMNRFQLLILLALFCFVGCKESSSADLPVPPVVEPIYGCYTLGEEEIPVVSCTSVSDTQFLLKLSPQKDILSATTYAVVGVHQDWLGMEMNVEYRFHNDDYLFVYEDPVRYVSSFRPLRSGSIFMDCNEAGYIKVRVDVVLYDGTPFRYENDHLLPPTPTDEAL